MEGDLGVSPVQLRSGAALAAVAPYGTGMSAHKSGSKSSRAREIALGALRAFYDYAVFQAMDVLPDGDSDALLSRLDQERVKLEK